MSEDYVQKSEKRIQEIIQQLSQWHKSNSTDPLTLCTASFHDYDLTKTTIRKYQEYSSELFELSQSLGHKWTEI